MKYQKIEGRNYVEFKDLAEMRDIINRSNQEGFSTRVVVWELNSVTGKANGIVEFWK